MQKLEALLVRTFTSLTVIGQTSVDYRDNACFQTLQLGNCHTSHCHNEHTEWMNSMMEVLGDVSAQDCFLFCTASEGFNEAGFSADLRDLRANIEPIYHHGKRGKINVTIRLSELRKLESRIDRVD